MTRTDVPGTRTPAGRADSDLDRLSFGLPPLGGPRRTWREQVLARVVTLHGVRAALGAQAAHGGALPRGEGAGSAESAAALVRDEEISTHLRIALEAATTEPARGPSSRRARMDRAFAHVDEAQASVLGLLPDCDLRGQLPGLVAHVQSHLPPAHPQRVGLQKLADLTPPVQSVDSAQRAACVDALRTASAAERREHARLRSFRAILVATAAGLGLLAVGLLALATVQPGWIPLCFTPGGSGAVVCPTSTAPLPVDPGTAEPTSDATAVARTIAATASAADPAVVMLLGLAAAAVTGAAALRRVRGTSTPFSVPVALLLLKLPTGALTALFGLVLIHGGFVPGLSALDTSGQILAWALLFGAAQQLVTGTVDKKAQSVLDSVGPTPMTEEKE